MSKTVIKTSVFNTDIEKFFSLIQKLDTLQYIAKPYATFKSMNNENDLIWETGKTFSFKFKVFGCISLGIHTIKVREFNRDGIYTNESNRFCPVWNHRIIIEKIDETHIRYTDEVEINAGRKTKFIYVWAKAFYKHRQKKWKKLLKK